MSEMMEMMAIIIFKHSEALLKIGKRCLFIWWVQQKYTHIIQFGHFELFELLLKTTVGVSDGATHPYDFERFLPVERSDAHDVSHSHRH